jgi:hypothetical protein
MGKNLKNSFTGDAENAHHIREDQNPAFYLTFFKKESNACEIHILSVCVRIITFEPVSRFL